MNHSKGERNRITVASVNQAYLPYVVVDFGILSMSVLLDSGATRCIINYDTFLKLRVHGLRKRIQDTSIKCTTATSEEVDIVCCATVKIKIHRFSWYVPLLVSKNSEMQLILGADFIRKTGVILDIRSKSFYHHFPLYDTPEGKPVIGTVDQNSVNRCTSPDLSLSLIHI